MNLTGKLLYWWRIRKAPASLADALHLILDKASRKDLFAFAATPREKAGAGLHFGPGMSMRNDWGLWFNDTGIAQELQAAGIHHGDDRSGVIYTALWCKLNNQPFSLAEEAKKYKDYWASKGCNPDGSPLRE